MATEAVPASSSSSDAVINRPKKRAAATHFRIEATCQSVMRMSRFNAAMGAAAVFVIFGTPSGSVSASKVSQLTKRLELNHLLWSRSIASTRSPRSCCAARDMRATSQPHLNGAHQAP